MKLILHKHFLFWKKHPALLIGMTLLVGAMNASYTALTLLSACLLSFYLLWVRKYPYLFLLLGMSVYTDQSIHPVKEELLSKKLQGIFSISSMKLRKSSFDESMYYEGTFHIQGENPLTCYVKSPTLYQADHHYLIQGTLTRKGAYAYKLSPNPAIAWVPISKTWGLAQLQFQTKERIKKCIQDHCIHPKTALLLYSLLTGEIDHPMLKWEFSQLGLQHVLAVSGFHFGIIILFFSFLLNLFLGRQAKIISLLFIVNLYYFLIGPLPGVQRSWLVAMSYLLGQLFKRQTNGLNLLGFAMGAELIINPLIWQHLGFQLSFASCFGILLYFRPIEEKIKCYLPQRSMAEIATLTFLAKHGYLISSFLRKTISLSLSINMILIPLLLYHFHAFPCLSFIYNLFIPFCLSGSLFTLFLSFSLYPLIQPVGNFLFSLTDRFATEILNLIAYPPVALDFWLFTQSLHESHIFLYLLLYLTLGIHLYKHQII